MAELTGIPLIDIEITRFRAACGMRSAADLALAAGACVLVNDAFARQLHEAGLVAHSADENCHAHVVTIVEHEGQRFSVDFSATPHGDRNAFPLVRRHVDGDVWEADWAL